MLVERGVHGIEVRFEVPLRKEPQRIDFLVVRAIDDIDPKTARALLGLWSHLRRELVIEYKSVSREYASRDLDRLVAYGLQRWCAETESLVTRTDLTLALVVATWNTALRRDLESLAWTTRELSPGYHGVDDAPFEPFIVDLDVVAEEEHDLLVRSVGHDPIVTPEVRSWWWRERGVSVMGMKDEEVKELEGYDELERRFLESVPVDRRLAGIPAEERLADIAPEERWLALTEDELRMLPETLVASLPPSIQSRIRERLAR